MMLGSIGAARVYRRRLVVSFGHHGNFRLLGASRNRWVPEASRNQATTAPTSVAVRLRSCGLPSFSLRLWGCFKVTPPHLGALFVSTSTSPEQSKRTLYWHAGKSHVLALRFIHWQMTQEVGYNGLPLGDSVPRPWGISGGQTVAAATSSYILRHTAAQEAMPRVSGNGDRTPGSNRVAQIGSFRARLQSRLRAGTRRHVGPRLRTDEMIGLVPGRGK